MLYRSFFYEGGDKLTMCFVDTHSDLRGGRSFPLCERIQEILQHLQGQKAVALQLMEQVFLTAIEEGRRVVKNYKLPKEGPVLTSLLIRRLAKDGRLTDEFQKKVGEVKSFQLWRGATPSEVLRASQDVQCLWIDREMCVALIEKGLQLGWIAGREELRRKKK